MKNPHVRKFTNGDDSFNRVLCGLLKTNKTFTRTLLLLTVSLFTTFLSRAQQPPGFSATNMHIRMLNQMVNNRYWYRKSDLLENNKYKFTVTLKDGSTKEVVSKIYTDSVLRSAYLLIINKRLSRSNRSREERIYPKQTLKISRLYQDSEHPDKKELLEGRATDSCWLFKAISGKLSAYSFLSERINLSTAYLSAFQVDSGRIQTLTPEKLKPVLASSARAMKAFNKKDYYTAIIRYNKEIEQKSSKKK